MVLKLPLYPLPFISLPNAFSSSLGSRMSNMGSTVACFCSIVHVRNVVITKKNPLQLFRRYRAYASQELDALVPEMKSVDL